MKKLITFAVFLCLLLCGCGDTDPKPTGATTDPTKESSTQESQTPTTSPTTSPTQATTEPTQAPPEIVTVYLLEQSVLADSGFTSYRYDDNHNIDSYEVYTIENTLMYTTYFDEKDDNGMGGQRRTHWGDDESGETQTLTYFDGKLKEERDPFSSVRYEYDGEGDLIEKRTYYEDVLYSAVKYEYSGNQLTAVSCEGEDGTLLFECVVENGRITEKISYEYGGEERFAYRYDENGNLVEELMSYEGELFPVAVYTYRAVEVDADRAVYLLEQQKYLVSVT